MKNIYVTSPSMPGFDEYISEIEHIWNSRWLTNMGEEHRRFHDLLVEYLNVDNIELLVNGHMALEMTIQAYDFPKGSEVITTPFTFASTTHAIVRNGLIPVFCDINKNDYLIDVNKIEELVTDKTVAILPVHVYGGVCNVIEIDRIAHKHKLKVIYDAAHAFGEKVNGVGIGNFGDASCFSFHATKVFNSIEGGASCYRDKSIGSRIYDLKNFGIHGINEVYDVGGNAKMNEFCAAMGICNLKHIADEIEKRRILFEYYTQKLDGSIGIKLPEIQKNVISNYAYYPITIDETVFKKDCLSVYNDLMSAGIFSRRYFYPLTSDFECYKNIYDSSKTPNAKWISERVLTLPLYADLTFDDIDRIVDVIID